MRLVLLATTFLFAMNAFAAAGRSAKKIEADNNSLRAPQVVEQGDNMIGIRAHQGDIFDSKPLAGVNYEHMIAPNFGAGGSFLYAQYDSSVTVGELKGRWEYDAYVYALYGSYHFDLFKAKNLDTSISAGIGRTVLRSHWTSNMNASAQGEADDNSTYLLGYANARYFINSQFAFTGAIGISLGTLALGMDYLF